MTMYEDIFGYHNWEEGSSTKQKPEILLNIL